jgi:Gas vesicle protein G
MGFLSLPLRGLIRVFEEVAERAEKEMYDGDAVMAELTELYRMLESGAIAEEEFDRREAALVERLEEIEEHNAAR